MLPTHIPLAHTHTWLHPLPRCRCRASFHQAASAGPAGSRGVLGSFMARISLGLVGKEALGAADLAEPLEDMKRKLMERNVAEEIAMQVGGVKGPW